jgi:hypothetical protein
LSSEAVKALLATQPRAKLRSDAVANAGELNKSVDSID